MGILDESMRDLASTLANTFRTSFITLSRSTSTYNTATGADVVVVSTASVVAPPPSLVKAERGTLSVRLEGTYAYSLPAKDLDTLDTPYIPATGDTITDGNLIFTIVEVQEVRSGDQVALYKVFGKK